MRDVYFGDALECNVCGSEYCALIVRGFDHRSPVNSPTGPASFGVGSDSFFERDSPKSI